MHQLDPETETTVPDEDSLYPFVHNPISHNCAIILEPHNFNSTELHQQGVAPRSQYSDHMLEVVMLQ